jgi:hypothetical protein
MSLMILQTISGTVRPVTGEPDPLPGLTRDGPLTLMTATLRAMPINKLY